MNLALAAFLAPAVAIVATAAAGVSAAERKALDAVLAKAFPADGPGAMVAVVRDGRIVYQAGRGYADVKRKAPFTADTAFDLASVSKHFTGVAVMRLAERGKLDLEADVRTYVPELKKRKGRAVRVIDMVHMVSGLADYSQLDPMPNDLVAVARAVAKEAPQFKPGKKYVYNNSDYALLALVVERAAGKPLAAVLREEVFRPLGMTRTRVVAGPGEVPEGAAQGYAKQKRGVTAVEDVTGVVGDGQVYSTVADLARWDAAIRRGAVLSAASWKRVFTSGRTDGGKATGYGFGWSLSGDPGDRVVSHSGSWTGTATYIRRDLEAGLTVIVLSNLEDFAAEELGDALMNALGE